VFSLRQRLILKKKEEEEEEEKPDGCQCNTLHIEILPFYMTI
jgi:hypothetical protein